MLSHPAEKYRPYPPIALPDRRWPDRQISHAPRWLSTDLRDGNQALAEPMDSALVSVSFAKARHPALGQDKG
ncbi:hypothetical protein CKQ90_28310 [Klebsiella pneumoniae]|nr:hypothetical protein CKQ90_28310 [Klebsiella pneumoniae]